MTGDKDLDEVVRTARSLNDNDVNRASFAANRRWEPTGPTCDTGSGMCGIIPHAVTLPGPVNNHNIPFNRVQPVLPTDPTDRKNIPIGTGVLDYFPLALAEVAKVSKAGNDQHNPGQPLHWARGKSTDEYDTMIRHSLERGTFDTDGQRHSAKMVWRALAILQKELEADLQQPVSRASREA